jgi:hypothetical protein
MISWILGSILFIWCLYKRFKTDERLEGAFGFPKGTTRALIAIIVVAFPFNYLLTGKGIPSAIISAIFILVAFYFDSRKTKREETVELIYETKFPEKAEKEAKLKKYPLYLPKYSVRTILLLLLVFILVININGPNLPFQITNTIVDILLLIFFFMIGAFFKSLINIKDKKKTKVDIKSKLNEDPFISDEKIMQFLSKKKKYWWDAKGLNSLAIITLIAVVIALFLYTIDLDYDIWTQLFYQFTLRTSLFMFINLYYGFRD